MRYRKFMEIVERNGRASVSKWLDKNMDKRERAKFDAFLDRIEIEETENESWLAPYVSLGLWEVRWNRAGRAVRILSWRRSTQIVMLVPAAKKGNLTKAEESRAERLQRQLQTGEASVREYYLPTRP